MRGWWVWATLLAAGCPQGDGDGDDTEVDTEDTVETEDTRDSEDTDDTTPPDDPCDPDPCAGTPGTVCDGGFCVTTAVTLSGAGATWEGEVVDLATGAGWTFTTAAAGAGATATVAVDGGAAISAVVSDPDTVAITWGGLTFDGDGELSPDEAAALDALQADADLIAGLSRVPLELGCTDAELAPAAVAALLAPWQLVLKYRVADRRFAVQALADAARCDWFPDPTAAAPTRKAPVGHFLFGREAPIPVVVGWLPLDGVGEIPQAAAAAGDLWGPCGALCRGTCGIDCPWVNCNRTTLAWCEQVPGQGGNTGMLFDAVELDCGTATGCVNHDDCYDTCNATHGCGTWAALACRSGRGGCDEVACLTHGVTNCGSWAAGLGPYGGRITYTFPPNTPGSGTVGVLDLQTCPVDDGRLRWEVSPPSTPIADAQAADAYCAGLEADGYDDWRLPYLHEIETIEVGCPLKNCLDISVYGVPFCDGCRPGQGPGANGCYLDPRLAGPCGSYWTATPWEDYPNDPLPGRYVWNAEYATEYVQSSWTYPNYYVRCVRP